MSNNNFITHAKGILLSLFNEEIIFLTTLFSAAFAILDIYVPDDEFFKTLFLSFSIASVYTICYSHLTRKLDSIARLAIQALLSLTTAGVCFFLFHNTTDSAYELMYYHGLLFSGAAFIVFLLSKNENDYPVYANIIKYLFFTGLLAFLLFLGTTLLVLAFSYLIYEIHDLYKVLESLAFFFFLVVHVNFYVYYLFEKNSEKSGRAFKIIFLYTLFPVYLLLILVLYTYLIKALVQFKMPVGTINWFVSFASAFFILFRFTLQEFKDSKIISLFYKYGGLLLIPLIIIQSWACFERISIYGFTGTRYSSLLVIIFTMFFIVVTFIKNGKYTRFTLPVLIAFFIISCLSPLNLIHVGYKSQMNRITAVMTKYEMLENGELKNFKPEEIQKNITEEDLNTFISARNYLTNKTAHKTPSWISFEKNNSLYQIHNTPNESNSATDSFSDGIYKDLNQSYNIGGYSTFYKAYLYYNIKNNNKSENPKNKNIIITINEKEFDISKNILQIKEAKQSGDVSFPYYLQLDDSHMIIINYLSFEYDKEKEAFNNCTIDYLVLVK